MPLHTNAPGQTDLVFVHPKEGKFVIETTEGTEKYSAIEGTLELVRVEFDPGNPAKKVNPYDAFIMHIKDETKLYRIKMAVDRNFTYSVARVLSDLNKGDHILAKVKSGDDKSITFCNILKSVNGEWVRPDQIDLPKDKTEKVAFVKKLIQGHSAYSPKKEEA
jgi:hypothetical protein